MAELRPALATLTAPYRWLVSLTIAGRVVRVSTGGPVTITGNDGEVYTFTGGLGDVGFERALDLWVANPSPRSLSLEMLLGFDLAQMVARGAAIFAARGELAQWYEGQPWESRRVVLRGLVQEPAFGALGEVFAFALVEDPGDDLALVPRSSWVVETGATWEETGTLGPDPGIVGSFYPLIIGAPGQAVGVGTTSTSLSDEIPATPALLVRRDASGGTAVANHWILLCGGTSKATSIKVYNATNDSKTFTQTAFVNVNDALGQPVTYVQPDSTSNSPVEGDQLFAIWDPATGGGLQNPYGTGTLRGAGDVIRWALDKSSLRVDNSRLSELKILNSYHIDTYINGPVSPWSWLLAEVLPLLPVTVGTGPDGLFVVPWLARALSVSQSMEDLEEGRNCTRQGAVVYTSTSEVYNDLTIRFAPNIDSGSFALHQTLNGETWTSTDPNTSPGLWCRRSASIFGKRSMSLEASVIYDPATAGAVLTDMARRHSHPRREIIYRLPRTLDWLRPGDVITLTDAALHLSSVVGLVGSIAYAEDDLTAQIVLFEPLVFAA